MTLFAFKAIIRVVKSISIHDSPAAWGNQSIGSVDVVREPLLYAKNEAQVKELLVAKYPQFFPGAKVYKRETRDEAQFFYVLIYPLQNWEKINLESGEWACAGCDQVHSNQYLSPPRIYSSFSKDLMFCRCHDNDDACLNMYKKANLSDMDEIEDLSFVRADSPTYIYKITEKSTSKCYIGKTRNAPFFRWWNHLRHSSSPFGTYFRETQLDCWSFEVLETLDSKVADCQVFEIETRYIHQFNAIENGFNTVVSKRDLLAGAAGN